MKTKPANLLLALMLGFTGMAFVSTSAIAGDDNSSKQEQDAKDAKDSKDAKDAKDAKDTEDAKAASSSCTSKLVEACGLKVIETTCSVAKFSSATKDKDGKDESDDKDHESKAKDSDGKNDHDRNNDAHHDHKDRSQGESKEGDGKVSICHRMGGSESEVSLTVANNGYSSGHSKHALDTIGRCDDFKAIKDSEDSKDNKDKDSKISISDTGYSVGLTTSQVSCLNDKSSSTVSYTIPAQKASRGGVKSLH